MSEPVTITMTYDHPLFDPEDHRQIAASRLGLDPTKIHCISCGPDTATVTTPEVYSEDGTLLSPRVVSYSRITTWGPKPVAAAPPQPEAPPEPDPVVHHIPKLSRGARWNGVLDGVEGNYISTGDGFVLLDSADGLALLANLVSE